MNTNTTDRPLMLGGRLFWEIEQPNGSRELVADDGQPTTEAEWQEFCAFAKLVCEATARKAKARKDAARERARFATIPPGHHSHQADLRNVGGDQFGTPDAKGAGR